MREANHTPGPWNVVFHGKAAYVSMFIGKDDLPASATGNAEFSVQPFVRPAEAEANARLIVACVNSRDAILKAADAYLEATGAVTGVEPQRRALIAALKLIA